MNIDLHSSLLQRIKLGLLRRARWFFCALAVFVLLQLLLFWQPLQRQWLTCLLVHSDAPSPEVLSDAVNQSSNPKSLLLRFWQTQRIPHRHFVLSYLGRTVNSEQHLFHALEPVVMDATADADIETRELAFAALARTKHPQLRRLALEQLEDADPAARLLGLQNLRSIATSNDVPIAMGLLHDSEPRVVVAAALVLRQATAQDFGIRSSHALPQFTGMGTNAPPAPDLNAIRQGVQRWQDWWIDHQAEYPASRQPSRIGSQPARLATSDFSLQDSEGKKVHLSDYRRKVVLLAFCSPDTPSSFDGVPALAALQARNLESTAVLGICIPPATNCAEEHEDDHGSEHALHQHDETSAPVINLAPVPSLLQGTMLELKANFPMLLDSKGTVGRRFDVQNLPTYVLIDAQGMIRRRFAGHRTKQVLEAMIEEVSGPSAEHTQKP